jgi:[acyl-carrier-protein] S-malonyltransferase
MANNRKTAFIFPGQGAQYVGMGKDFVESFPVARQTFEEADDILGRKLSDVILDGPGEALTETRNSQPAIFVNSIAILRVLAEQFPALKPQVCAGLSLGEYTALTASGRLSFGDTLQLVQDRANFMNDACEAQRGSMAVVMGMEHEAVEKLVMDLNLPQDLWAANFNCPGQVVLSGTPKGIEAGSKAALENGARRVLPIRVHGAFHSGLMASAEESLAGKVGEASLKKSDIGLVMNVVGAYVPDVEDTRKYLIQQVTRPVRWEQGVRAMMAEGVDFFLEIGCGSTLIGMNKRIGFTGLSVSLDKVNDLERLNGILVSA